MAVSTTLSPAACVLARVAGDPAPAAAALGVSPQQALNLARLAAYLRTLPGDYDKFEMSWYYSVDDLEGELHEELLDGEYRPLSARYECGTTACAVGHGPAAGVAAQSGEEWGTYAQRVFVGCLGEDSYQRTVGKRLFEALFDGEWSAVDNSPRGAAARIAYALEGGTPAVERLNETEDAEAVGLYRHYLD